MRATIAFKSDVTSAEIDLYLRGLESDGITPVMRLPLVNGVVVVLPPHVDAGDLLDPLLVDAVTSDSGGLLTLPNPAVGEMLELLPGLTTAVTDVTGHLSSDAESFFESLLGINRPWGVLQLYNHTYDPWSTMDRLDAWRVPWRISSATLNSWRVKIAVFDTGIDITHPQLASRVRGGADVVDFAPGIPSDRHGHGTHVSGTIAARDYGLAGLSELYAVKVLADDGGGTLINLLMALQWAVDHDIDVVNMSIGFRADNPLVRTAVREANEAGVLLVAAVGNHSNWDDDGSSADGASADGASADGASADGASADGASADGASADGASADGASADGASSATCMIYGSADGASADGASADGASADGASASPCATRPRYSVMYPGAYPETLAVSAYDPYGVEASFSNSGPETDLMGPGVRIISTLPGNRYGVFNGTSMATPHITAAAALLIAYAKRYGKAYTNDDIKAILVGTSSGGIPDLDRALRAVTQLPNGW